MILNEFVDVGKGSCLVFEIRFFDIYSLRFVFLFSRKMRWLLRFFVLMMFLLKDFMI